MKPTTSSMQAVEPQCRTLGKMVHDVGAISSTVRVGASLTKMPWLSSFFRRPDFGGAGRFEQEPVDPDHPLLQREALSRHPSHWRFHG